MKNCNCDILSMLDVYTINESTDFKFDNLKTLCVITSNICIYNMPSYLQIEIVT